MRLISLMILIGVIAVMFAGQSIYTYDLENNDVRDIYNFTEEKIKWNDSLRESISNSFEGEINLQEYNVNTKRFGNILGAFVNFVGYSFTEVMKFGIEYGYNHPDYDLKFFLEFLIKIIWIMVLLALIPLIIPILALICILGKGIIWMYKKIFKKDD